MAIVPPLEALRAALLADPLLAVAVGEHVYVDVVPARATPSLEAEAGVMLRHAGGPGAARHAALLAVRVDVHAFGATPYAAMLAHYAAHDALRRVERLTIAGTLIHSVLPEAGPMSVTNPTTEYPEVVSTWALLTAEEVPA